MFDDITEGIDYSYRIWHMDFKSFRNYYHSLTGEWILQDECMYLKSFIINGKLRRTTKLCDQVLDQYIKMQERGVLDA